MSATPIIVELRPHTGLKSTRIGVLEVHLGQSMVLANGTHVGYLGDESFAGIKFINLGLPHEAKEEIKRQVDAILGRVTAPVANAAPIME